MAVSAGIVFMAIGDAPTQFIIINAATLLGIALLIWAGPPASISSVQLILTAIIVALMAVTLISGIAIDDVRRWLPLGPLRLHAGMLLLPAFVVIIQRIEPRFALAAVTVFALVIGVQPDFASALALALSMVVVAFSLRQIWAYIATVISIGTLAVCVLNMAQLPPVTFVEEIMPDAWAIHPALAIVLGAVLLSAILWPIRLWNLSKKSNQTERLAFAACITGFAIASLVGSYPVPLLGYGASSIIGYGLGVALFTRIPVLSSDRATQKDLT